MKQTQAPKVPHIENKEWLYFMLDDVIMYYKVIGDLPNNDLKVCVITVAGGYTTDGVYEAKLQPILDEFNITYDKIGTVTNTNTVSQLEFIYEATYDYLNGHVFNGNNYFH